MAVTKTNIPEGELVIRSGPADYFAVVDTSIGITPVVDIRYSSAKYRVINKEIIEPAYTHPLIGRIDQANPVRSDLEVFLLTLYFGNFYLGYDKIQNIFDTYIKDNNLTGDYDSINVIDFMVLTGAKERNYRKPDNTVQDIMQLGPADARPTLSEVEDTDEGNRLMIDIVKYRDLRGFIPHLFAAKAISFDDLVEVVEHFYPDLVDRNNYYATDLGPNLKLKQAPLFNSSQLQKLGLL